jgi:hypothetical protein
MMRTLHPTAQAFDGGRQVDVLLGQEQEGIAEQVNLPPSRR